MEEFEMKLIDAYNLEGLYSKLSSRTDLPIKTTYKLLKFFDSIKKDSDFYREELVKILNEYAQRDENNDIVMAADGKNILVKPDCTEECEKKLNELAVIDAETPSVTFSIEELPDGLSLQELQLLRPFIEEEE